MNGFHSIGTPSKESARWRRACQAAVQLNILMRRMDKPCIRDLASVGRLGDDSMPAIVRTRPGQLETVGYLGYPWHFRLSYIKSGSCSWA